jgi:hypothetical protein
MKTLPLFLFLASCSIGPTMTVRKDGSTLVTTGGAFLEKTANETAYVKTAEGAEMSYTKNNKDQTVVVNTAIRTWGTVSTVLGLAEEANAGEAIREKAQVAKTVSDNSVKKAQVAADVTKATFVPHVPTPP